MLPSAPDFFGLLYLAPECERAVNLASSGDATDVYVRCAVNSARSFARFGYNWRLITNDAPRIAQRCTALGLSAPPLEPLEFAMSVPAGLGFAAAHRKLEVIARFGDRAFGPRPALVDLDTELVRPIPTALLEEPDAVHALDLTQPMTREFGTRLGAYQAAILDRQTAAARWFGGEFICAPAAVYARIAALVAQCWHRYLTLAPGSVHEGDEALVSAALSALAGDGAKIVDAGAEGVVARWWSARTNVAMPRFREIAGAALLHLPADKPFLAARAGREPDPRRFVEDYRRALGAKLRIRQAAGAIEALLGKTARHPPRW